MKKLLYLLAALIITAPAFAEDINQIVERALVNDPRQSISEAEKMVGTPLWFKGDWYQPITQLDECVNKMSPDALVETYRDHTTTRLLFISYDKLSGSFFIGLENQYGARFLKGLFRTKETCRSFMRGVAIQ